MSLAEEFTGRPLVADSVTGVREFDVDSLGRLCGVSVSQVWTPGVNEAKCSGSSFLAMRAQLMRYTWISSKRYASGGVIHNDPQPNAEPEQEQESKHQVAGLSCSCGFYAYTDTDDRAYDSPDRVTGIIRGTGVATVGSRGFRVERAEIVALVDPRSRTVSRVIRAWDAVSRWADSLGGALPLLALPGMLGGFALTTWASMTISLWFLALAVIPIVSVALIPASFHGIDLRHAYHRDFVDFNLVRRNYPDVPVYPSLRAALKDHPLSTPSPPHVPSPADDDFWTRSAR